MRRFAVEGKLRRMGERAHSAAYLGDQRDFFWNADFLELMARRLDLARVRDALDAGCGLGHWSRALLPHLPEARLVGVDREPSWVAGAREAARRSGLDARTSYRVGDVERLAFADASFDLVTCQTLLIHVPDVKRVLREFRRVLRPGGLLLVAEPNNLASAAAFGHPQHDAPVDELMALLRLQLVCERGKIALGEGDNSVGELLPGWFHEVGLADVAVWQSDHAWTLVPPYASRESRLVVDQVSELYDNGFWIWSREETERWFVAGGGARTRFDELWELARASKQAELAALREGRYHAAGGGLFYLVAGREPPR